MSKPANNRFHADDAAAEEPVTLSRAGELRNSRSRMPILIRLPDLSQNDDKYSDEGAAPVQEQESTTVKDDPLVERPPVDEPRLDDDPPLFEDESSDNWTPEPRETVKKHSGAAFIDYAWQVAVCLALVTTLLVAHAALTGRFSGPTKSVSEESVEDATQIEQEATLLTGAETVIAPSVDDRPTGRLIAVEFNHDQHSDNGSQVHHALDARTMSANPRPNVMYPPNQADPNLPRSRYQRNSPSHVAELRGNLKPPPR